MNVWKKRDWLTKSLRKSPIWIWTKKTHYNDLQPSCLPFVNWEVLVIRVVVSWAEVDEGDEAPQTQSVLSIPHLSHARLCSFDWWPGQREYIEECPVAGGPLLSLQDDCLRGGGWGATEREANCRMVESNAAHKSLDAGYFCVRAQASQANGQPMEDTGYADLCAPWLHGASLERAAVISLQLYNTSNRTAPGLYYNLARNSPWRK